MFTGVSASGATSEPDPVSFRVELVGETDSTNDDVMARARSGEPEGLVLVADVQRAGRGRRGRRWEAPAGSSLLSSWLFAPPAAVPAAAVTAVVGIAAADACRALGAPDVSLKWPNDLVVSDRKMAGMLAESVIRGSEVETLVVGIGVNVSEAALPPEIAAASTSLEAAGGRPDRDQLLSAMVDRVDHWYGRLLGGGTPSIREAWRDRSSTPGRMVRIELDDETFAGRAVDIDDDFALVVDVDGKNRTVTVADIVHLRPA